MSAFQLTLDPLEAGLMESLQGVAYNLGMMKARMEDHHTCRLAHYRYPWPLDPKCDGCRHTLEKFVNRNHLTMAYHLLGWEIMVDHMERDINRRAAQAQAYRNMGAYI